MQFLLLPPYGVVAQLVERELCKLEVEGASPFNSTSLSSISGGTIRKWFSGAMLFNGGTLLQEAVDEI